MGVSDSVQLKPHFKEINQENWSRAQTVVQAYATGNYDFGIDYNVVMNITGYDSERAKVLLQAHAINDVGVINALSLLITFVALVDNDGVTMGEERVTEIFNLFDFSRSGVLSLEDLTILLMCVSYSFSHVVQRHSDVPSDAAIIKLAQQIYDKLNKKYKQTIKKDELAMWARINLFEKGITKIDTVFDAFVKTCDGFAV
jgi:hypothetical protein